jgi:hypothetical protein
MQRIDDDKGDGQFAAVGEEAAFDAGVVNEGVADEDALELGGRDLEATDLCAPCQTPLINVPDARTLMRLRIRSVT